MRHTASSFSERSLQARAAAHLRWARTADRSAATAPARAALEARFEHEVDPDEALPLAERAHRAAHARRAFYARLALRSAQVRRRRTAKHEPPPSRRIGRVDAHDDEHAGD